MRAENSEIRSLNIISEEMQDFEDRLAKRLPGHSDYMTVICAREHIRFVRRQLSVNREQRMIQAARGNWVEFTVWFLEWAKIRLGLSVSQWPLPSRFEPWQKRLYSRAVQYACLS